MALKKNAKVFAIVLNYNGKDTIIDCLRSLYLSNYTDLEIILVDNASKDGSLELAKNTFPKINIIQNTENIGFSAGNNVGIRYALEKFADYIFLLNNDARVNKNTISILLANAEKDPAIGIASPLIMSLNPGVVWFAGGQINWLSMKTTHIKVPASPSYEIQYACGCAMLINKTVFKKTGLFDENYFLYYEDTDFSLQAKKMGFKIILYKDALVYHEELSVKNNANKIYWLVLSALIFFTKNSPRIYRGWYVFYILIRKIKNKIDLLTNKSDKSIQVKKAFYDFSLSKKEKI